MSNKLPNSQVGRHHLPLLPTDQVGIRKVPGSQYQAYYMGEFRAQRGMSTTWEAVSTVLGIETSLSLAKTSPLRGARDQYSRLNNLKALRKLRESITKKA